MYQFCGSNLSKQYEKEHLHVIGRDYVKPILFLSCPWEDLFREILNFTNSLFSVTFSSPLKNISGTRGYSGQYMCNSYAINCVTSFIKINHQTPSSNVKVTIISSLWELISTEERDEFSMPWTATCCRYPYNCFSRNTESPDCTWYSLRGAEITAQKKNKDYNPIIHPDRLQPPFWPIPSFYLFALLQLPS